MRDSPNLELEPVVPCIILKPKEEEEEEEMALNLRTGFKERHHKRLSEALPAAPLFAKKIRPEAFCEKLVPESPTTQVSFSNTVRFRQELVASSSIKRDA